MKGQKSFSVDFCLTGLFSHRKALSFSSSLGLPNQCLACGAMQKAHIICIVRGYLFCKKPNHVREEKQRTKLSVWCFRGEEQRFFFGFFFFPISFYFCFVFCLTDQYLQCHQEYIQPSKPTKLTLTFLA